MGPYEHFYNDFVFGEEVSTHYVVLGYRIVLDIVVDDLPKKQHGQYQWFTKEQMREDASVHEHSKWYI
ncbi:hypothetical protein [Vibrio variabilis]|uniref:hypothetical protein n=1 Tax=Vibrio variabilis TaxID=990271 RepID=UPI0030B804C9